MMGANGRLARQTCRDGEHGQLLEARLQPARGARPGDPCQRCGRTESARTQDRSERPPLAGAPSPSRHDPAKLHPAPLAIRQLRDLTAGRWAENSRERNRVQKVLEDANVKLGDVLSDVFCVTIRPAHAPGTARRITAAFVEAQLQPAASTSVAPLYKPEKSAKR